MMNKEMLNEPQESVHEMGENVNGNKHASRSFDYPNPEVKSIRNRLGVSQEKFAVILGVSKRTVENWEQGRRQPAGAARSLLRIVEADPEHAVRVLSI